MTDWETEDKKSSLITTYVFLILISTIFSGAIRKWVISSSTLENIILFVQLASPLGLLLLSNYFKEKSHHQGKILFNGYFLFLGICAINPLNLTIYHGLAGIIIHTGFWIILFLYIFYPKYFKIERYLWILTGIGVLEVILASIQYSSPTDAWINRYAIETENAYGVAKVSGSVRATGTFSYIAGYSSFMFLFLFINCYLIKVSKNNILKILITFIGIYGSLLSGSRGLVVFYLVILNMFLLFEIDFRKTIQTLFIITIISSALIATNNSLGDPLHIQDRFNTALENFVNRFEANQEEGESRIFKDVKSVFDNNFDYPLTGIGLGSTYQGANSQFGKNPILTNIYYEGELFRLMVEGGVVFVLMKFIMLAYVLSTFKFSFPFKCCIFIIMLLYVPTGFNIYNGIFFSTGLILLDKSYELEL